MEYKYNRALLTPKTAKRRGGGNKTPKGARTSPSSSFSSVCSSADTVDLSYSGGVNLNLSTTLPMHDSLEPTTQRRGSGLGPGLEDLKVSTSPPLPPHIAVATPLPGTPKVLKTEASPATVPQADAQVVTCRALFVLKPVTFFPTPLAAISCSAPATTAPTSYVFMFPELRVAGIMLCKPLTVPRLGFPCINNNQLALVPYSGKTRAQALSTRTTRPAAITLTTAGDLPIPPALGKAMSFTFTEIKTILAAAQAPVAVTFPEAAEEAPLSPLAVDSNEHAIEEERVMAIPTTAATTPSTSIHDVCEDVLDLPADIAQGLCLWGKAELLAWQMACLQTPGVLATGANLLISNAPTSGSCLVAALLLLRRVISTGKKALVVLPVAAGVQEKAACLKVILSPFNSHQAKGKKIHVRAFLQCERGFGGVHIALTTLAGAHRLLSKPHQLACVVVTELDMAEDRHSTQVLSLLLGKIGQIQRQQRQQERPQGLQLIGMSATLPNAEVVAASLDAALYTKLAEEEIEEETLLTIVSPPTPLVEKETAPAVASPPLPSTPTAPAPVLTFIPCELEAAARLPPSSTVALANNTPFWGGGTYSLLSLSPPPYCPHTLAISHPTHPPTHPPTQAFRPRCPRTRPPSPPWPGPSRTVAWPCKPSPTSPSPRGRRRTSPARRRSIPRRPYPPPCLLPPLPPWTWTRRRGRRRRRAVLSWERPFGGV